MCYEVNMCVRMVRMLLGWWGRRGALSSPEDLCPPLSIPNEILLKQNISIFRECATHSI